jgi:hypothetical protein
MKIKDHPPNDVFLSVSSIPSGPKNRKNTIRKTGRKKAAAPAAALLL